MKTACDSIPVSRNGVEPDRDAFLSHNHCLACTLTRPNAAQISMRQISRILHLLERSIASQIWGWGFGRVDKAQCFWLSGQVGAAGSSPDFSRFFSLHAHGDSRPLSKKLSFQIWFVGLMLSEAKWFFPLRLVDSHLLQVLWFSFKLVILTLSCVVSSKFTPQRQQLFGMLMKCFSVVLFLSAGISRATSSGTCRSFSSLIRQQ